MSDSFSTPYFILFSQTLTDRVMFEVTVTNPSTPATTVTPVSAATPPVLVTDVRRKGNLQVESPTMGVICIRDVFPSDGDSEEDRKPTCMVSVLTPQ